MGDAAVAMMARTYKVVWQVEIDFDWSTWLDYPADQNRRIEAAWQRMDKRVVVGSTEWSDGWLVDLDQLIQIGEQGTRRRIRRALITNT